MHGIQLFLIKHLTNGFFSIPILDYQNEKLAIIAEILIMNYYNSDNKVLIKKLKEENILTDVIFKTKNFFFFHFGILTCRSACDNKLSLK